ncbi:MAG: S-methyl-5-thioribose-1-phosphate isomerase [Candidatus Omnitrophica bacterium]|nr:S-methyl-5-thioribose-1-phosphate isomerase [Candidatus Omnitrophota bacterium]
MKLSPLFWPIELKGNTIRILDETLLPQKVTYLKAKDYKQACKAIKDMKTRAVGQVLLVMYTFLLEIKKNSSLPHLEKVAQALNTSRPTLSFKMLTDMVLGWARHPGLSDGQVSRSLREAALEKSILGFLEGLKYKRIEQAKEASALFSDADVILTHCNVSGLLPLIGEMCKEQGKRVSFYATETRPYLQGSRLTAWELSRAGFPVTLITDSMVTQVMSEGKITKVIVGADHLAQNGDIANKIGTYGIAIAAKHFNIPFYVLCPPPSKVKTGKEIPIEIRPDEEMFSVFNVCVAPKGVKCYYPAFDVTPHELISKHIYLKI